MTDLSMIDPRTRRRPAAPGRRAPWCAVAIAVAPLLAAAAAAAQSPDAMIREALSAAPPNLKDRVTVRDLQGNLLRDGDGEFTCYPAPDGLAGPMCLDREWRRWMAAWQAGEPFTASRVGISYMMAGDSPTGGASNVDPSATEPTADNEWVVEGPHVMIIVPDGQDLEGLPTDLDTGGPYVMWRGTPYEHIMLPVDERPGQRTVD